MTCITIKIEIIYMQSLVKDNRAIVKRIMLILIFFFCILLISISFLYHISVRWRKTYGTILFMIAILLYIFSKLKIFVVEKSSGVLWIKYQHILFGVPSIPTASIAEFKLKGYDIKKCFWGYQLNIIVQSDRGKVVKLKYRIWGKSKEYKHHIKSTIDRDTSYFK